MTPSEKLAAVEKAWLDQSAAEDFYFAAFDEPMHLRRSANILGALAAFEFGRYQGLERGWVENERAVWIKMVVSDTASAGGKLLDAFTRVCSRNGLFVLGTPTPLKPRDWDQKRPFDSRPETLLCWYIKHGFKVVQSGCETRVIHVPLGSSFEASFALGLASRRRIAEAGNTSGSPPS